MDLRKTILSTMIMICCLCVTEGFSASLTSCYKNTCAILTVPEQVSSGEAFDIQVEGYIENASGWDTSSYMLLQDADWHYDSSHLVAFSGKKLDSKGFNWGGSISKKYTINDISETTALTFVFGPRGGQHGYYDVAIDAVIEVAAGILNVALDIRPRACPNPLNLKQKGVLSAALVGSSEFDVTQVNVGTIELAGVEPLHHSYEDVTEAFFPPTGELSEYHCTEAGPDGHMDLVLKFRTQDVVARVKSLYGENLSKGDVLAIPITAKMSGPNGTKPSLTISGRDLVRINHKK